MVRRATLDVGAPLMNANESVHEKAALLGAAFRGVGRPRRRPPRCRLGLFAYRRHVLMLDRVVLVFLDAPFVAHDLSIEPVDHEIDRRVQVAVGTFDEDVLAL